MARTSPDVFTSKLIWVSDFLLYLSPHIASKCPFKLFPPLKGEELFTFNRTLTPELLSWACHYSVITCKVISGHFQVLPSL